MKHTCKLCGKEFETTNNSVLCPDCRIRKWVVCDSEEENTIDLIQPSTVIAEKLLQAVRELNKPSELGTIIIDSVPALTPETERE